jgi:flagellar biogenesis protein FliO
VPVEGWKSSKDLFFGPKLPRHTRCWMRSRVVSTNSISSMLPQGSLTNALAAPDLSSAAGSLGRMLGALALVLALLIGALWIYRHWQRLLLQRTPVTGLRVVDAKSLGQRTAVYVVAYRHQQFLIGGSPNGLSLLSPLDADSPESDDPSPLDPGNPAANLAPEGSFRSVLEKTLSPSA